MTQRTLGRSGLEVSLVGLGTNNFGGRIDADASKQVIHKALDLGISLFDTADVYGLNGGSETILGKVLGERRKDIVLATKFGFSLDGTFRIKSTSRRYIAEAVEASLKRLDTDWIDLYQVHKPDPKTPIEETLRTLDDLVRAGKIRYYGISNFAPWQLVDAQWTTKQLGLHPIISSQDEYSLLRREAEKELIPAVQSQGLGLLPYFPLANGLLTGKYKRGEAAPEGARLSGASALTDRYLTEPNLATAEKLENFALSRGHSLLELAFSWLAAQPAVASIIAGATRPEQLEQNVRAAEWALIAEDLAEIDHITLK